jgi:aspartyl-tRNA(Asn)/glutamyl-tRNA(Gln) amidotransferase subunit A
MQLIAKVLREDQLLQTAYAYEQSTDWHKQRPPLS